MSIADTKGSIDSIFNYIPNGTSNVVTHRWQHNKDQDLAGYGNLTYRPTIFHRDVEFMTGGMYRYKTRDNYENDYALQASVPNGSTPFTNISSVPLYFQTPGRSQGENTAVNLGNYTAHEKVGAGFIQAKFMTFKALQLLGGVRVENTQMDYTSNMPLTANERSETIHYTDVLPSIHLKYNIANNQAIRLSYFKSISRPTFHDLVPYIDNSTNDFTFQGNPMVKHTRADNLDLGMSSSPVSRIRSSLASSTKSWKIPSNTMSRISMDPARFISCRRIPTPLPTTVLKQSLRNSSGSSVSMQIIRIPIPA